MSATSIPVQRLPALLKKNLPNLCVLTGDVLVLMNQAKQSIAEQAHKQGFEEVIRLTVQSIADLEQLKTQLSMSSLFATKSWIECTIASNKLGKKGYDALQSCCDNIDEHHGITLLFPLVEYAQKKQKWFMKLTSNALVVDCKAPMGKGLNDWISHYCKKQKLELTNDQTQQLLAATEGNLSACAQEIQKLALLADGKSISDKTLLLALSDSSTFTLFQIVDHALEGNARILCRTLSRLHQQALSPVLMLWSLVREVRLLINIKADLLRRKPWDLISRENRLWSTRQALVKKALDRLNIQQLLQLLEEASKVEMMLKGLDKGDITAHIDALFLKLAGCTIKHTLI